MSAGRSDSRFAEDGAAPVYWMMLAKTRNPAGQPCPKCRTHKGAAKRFGKTGTGKIVRGQSKMRHILTSKETKTKRKLAHSALVSDADYAKVARMIPYA